ncbi:ferritin-like domain-containing protein [Vallitalea okinawensis]|uniref:ferritin-like domain-containing protein n=1 Tax=Vallitalea okinawensis TaxID=2078660 RepID=UPI000CFB7259|nr:ferritin family protein [Vallitalea okinawensis]
MHNASIGEILRFAISIEEEGVGFYNKYSELAKGEVKELMLKLANDEIAHAEVFQKMYEEFAGHDDYLFTEEVDQYFHSYANHVGFSRRKQELHSIEEALAVAIETEKITTDFYKGLIDKTKDEKLREVLVRLVEEESDHGDILQLHLNAIKN